MVRPEAVKSDVKTGLARVPDLQALSVWDDMESGTGHQLFPTLSNIIRELGIAQRISS